MSYVDDIHDERQRPFQEPCLCLVGDCDWLLALNRKSSVDKDELVEHSASPWQEPRRRALTRPIDVRGGVHTRGLRFFALIWPAAATPQIPP